MAFKISSDCISCGACAASCPVSAISEGDKNVYFVDGKTMFAGDFRSDCTLDGCHPNDLGFYRIAKRFIKVIKDNKLLEK